jgi:hypothetical protein
MFEDQDDFDFNSGPQNIDHIIENWQRMMMRRLVEENFEKLSTQGIDGEQVKMWDKIQIETLIETFNYMISEFEEEEEYEKCAVLTQARQALIDRRAFQPQNI